MKMTSKGQQAVKAQEWKADKRWNPFNSYKLLVHVDRWKHILRGRTIPAPVLITVDPTNVCNFDCAWCNAEYIRQHRNFKLSQKALTDLADFLPRWGEGPDQKYTGVKAICIAGGGEPLMNPNTGYFVDRVVNNGVEVGMVTNGSLIHKYIDHLSLCTWVGVSVDAGSSKNFNALKGLPKDSGMYDKVISNMELLVDYSRHHNTMLGKPHPSYGVNFKYLLYPGNIEDVFQAAKTAKEIGCKSIHFRPAGTPWDKIGTPEEIRFTPEDVAHFNEQIAKAQELDDDTFSVFGVTHKFNDQFGIQNAFSKCYSIFMTAVVMPPPTKESPKDSFSMGLCCDRRGDDTLELLSNCEDVNEINKAWGGNKHWEIHDAIDIEADCPRCTYQPHNQIFENVILNDSMTHKFI